MVDNSSLNSRTFLISDVEDWCDLNRVNQFNEFLRPLQSIMLWGTNFKSIATAWVLREMVMAVLDQDQLDKPSNYIDSCSSKVLSWEKNETIYQRFDPSVLENELKPFLMYDVILNLWAKREWGHRLEAIYLERKNQLDRVSCAILRVTDQYLAAELYYRIKSNETSFEELSWKFGQGSEKKYGGKFINQRMQDLPVGFSQFLRKLKPGEVLKPHRIGNYYVLIQLDDYSPVEFNEETKRYLLSSELDAWLQAVIGLLSSKMEFVS